MLHHTRIWAIATVETAELLAQQLTQYSWCCCNGFRLGGYLFLNDSTGPDGAQEYAALKSCGDHHVQIESLTFSWMNNERALEIIRRVLDGEFDDEHYGVVPAQRIQSPAEHGRCHHCA